MATFTITRSSGGFTRSVTVPVTEPSSFTAATVSPRSDFIRGTGADDIIGRPLTAAEQATFDYLVARGFSEADAYDQVFLGQVQNAQAIRDQLTGIGLPASLVDEAILDGSLKRPLDAATPFVFSGFTEASFFASLFNPSFIAFLNGTFGTGFAPVATLDDAIAIQNLFSEAFGPGSLDEGPAVDNTAFGGDDRIFGQGGDDYIVDLAGNNTVVTNGGDDRILLGMGNDRVYDSGGDNRIDIQGGNNYIATRDGDDTITTGAGNDIINAFDGNNVIDAGEGNNTVRGGDDADIVRVGRGTDFVDVRQTGLLVDAFGNPILDSDGNTIDQDVTVTVPGLGEFADFGNIVVDLGGSDNIRATGNARNDQPGFPDKEFNGDDAVISDLAVLTEGDASAAGNDRIELGAGDNFIIDMGGNDTVRTLDGDDTIFTSFVLAGDDDIDAGAGADEINPGAGADRVRGGPDGDFINLENDGDRDTLVYREGDQTFSLANTDVVFGFDGLGLDRIDVSALGLTLDNLLILGLAPGTVGDPGLNDVLIAWDADANGAPDFFSTILADFNSGLLALDNFVFDDMIA